VERKKMMLPEKQFSLFNHYARFYSSGFSKADQPQSKRAAIRDFAIVFTILFGIIGLMAAIYFTFF
jgi:hypothetical protein